MKKSVLLIFVLAINVNFINAQNFKAHNPVLLPVSEQNFNFSRPLDLSPDKAVNKSEGSTGNPGSKGVSTSGIPINVGFTTYDLQSNASVGNKIYETSDGKIGIVFTRSEVLTPTFPDRGTGYNFFNGFTWMPPANSNLDTLVWASIDIGANNTEYVLGHNLATMANDLTLVRCSPAGSQNFTKSWLPPHPSGNFCQWARMRVGGTNGATVHVIALTKPVGNGGQLLNGIDGALTYSRSQDGGNTWDIIHIALPMVDNTHYAGMKADSYAIDVRGNVVAITQGSVYNDWVLWKSVDNGNSFTRTEIYAFPIQAYDVNTMSTDVNGDLVTDTIDFIDGSQTVLIDNNNMVHCFVGRMRVTQEVTLPFTVFPATDGLYYWNENYGIAPPQIIATAEEINGDGELTFPEGVQGYNHSLTGMPTAGIDGSSNIFLAYSGIVENTSNGSGIPAEEQAYRNIYCMASPDNGTSWSIPVRLNPSDFDEAIFPSIARNVNSELQIVYMIDGEPGLAVNGTDPLGGNDIQINSEDPEVLFPGITIVPFNKFLLKGTVYYDQNQNGINDGGDFGMMFYPLSISPGNFTSQTGADGTYKFRTDSGTFVINLVSNPDWAITSDSTSYTVQTNSIITDDLDFGVYPLNIVYSVQAILTASIPRCNNYINYWLTYTNLGTTPTSGTIEFVLDDLLTYESSDPVYNLISGDTLVWNFSNLLPSEQRQILVSTSSFGAVIGDTITNCMLVNYDDGATGGQAEDCATQVIVCSYDPNDKAVVPEGVDASHYTLINDTLVYTIRFQNTGTDTAFVVRIVDTLDVALNPATFRFIASSHPASVTTASGNILTFQFDNILLPDSVVDEPGSHGFIKYSIKPFQNITIGTVTNNTAHIFFDYNPAIITNTTFNTLVDFIGISEFNSPEYEIKVFPNPFSHQTTISFVPELLQSHSLEIVDVSGRLVESIKNISGNKITISSVKLTSGVYFAHLLNNEKNIIGVSKLLIY